MIRSSCVATSSRRGRPEPDRHAGGSRCRALAAGVLIANVSVASAYWIDAATFLVIIATLLRMDPLRRRVAVRGRAVVDP